jgi:hypothetical protein
VKLSFAHAEGRNYRQLPARARSREKPSPADIFYSKRYSLSRFDVSGEMVFSTQEYRPKGHSGLISWGRTKPTPTRRAVLQWRGLHSWGPFRVSPVLLKASRPSIPFSAGSELLTLPLSEADEIIGFSITVSKDGGKIRRERCKEQTGPSQTHGTSNYKGYVPSVPGSELTGVSGLAVDKRSPGLSDRGRVPKRAYLQASIRLTVELRTVNF